MNLLRPAAVALLAAVAVAGCGGGSDDDDGEAAPSSTSSQAPESAAAGDTLVPSGPVKDEPPADEPESEETSSFVMPSFVGMNLQDAQDRVQSELDTFFSKSHDLLEDRFQVLDRNWQVCDQSPSAGETVTGSAEGTIDFGVVKTDEACP